MFSRAITLIRRCIGVRAPLIVYTLIHSFIENERSQWSFTLAKHRKFRSVCRVNCSTATSHSDIWTGLSAVSLKLGHRIGIVWNRRVCVCVISSFIYSYRCSISYRGHVRILCGIIPQFHVNELCVPDDELLTHRHWIIPPPTSPPPLITFWLGFFPLFLASIVSCLVKSIWCH